MKLIFHGPPLSLWTRVRSSLRLLTGSLAALLLAISFCISATAASMQYVSISRQNASLESIFNDIKKQTGYLFFYKGSINTAALKLDVDLKHVSLEEALTTCLQPFKLTYTIVNKTIVISSVKSSAPAATVADPVQDEVVAGRITDSLSKGPVIGVTIVVKNKKTHAISNESGAFSIHAAQGDVLVFTSIGYKRKEVVVGKDLSIHVIMVANTSNIGEVVATGYQVIKKDNYTGNAIVIKGDDLKRMNSQNIVKGISAFDPSFRVAENNLLGADPNALPKINVRGSTVMPSSSNGQMQTLDRNNLTSEHNLPVFIMDGFEVTLQQVVDMDINRIASVTILKDAAATAVYGSRAANGVMVITTKAPVPGKLRLTYNYEFKGTAPDLTDYHVLNAKDKLEYERQAGLYSTLNAAYSLDELDRQYNNKYRDVVSGVNTYWLSQPLHNAVSHKHSLYAEGGDSTFRYGIDLRYQTDPGVMKGSGRDRYSGGMNFNYNPSRNVLVKNQLTITQVNDENSKYGSYSQYAYMNPYYPIYGEDGKIAQEIANWKIDTQKKGPNQIKNDPVYNPLYDATLGSFDKGAYQEVLDNLSVDWKITPALRLVGLMSVNSGSNTSDQFASPFSNEFAQTAPEDMQNRGRYDYTTTRSLSLDGNVRLIYNTLLGGVHSINAVLGGNGLSNKSDTKGFEGRGFSNDKFTNIGFARIYTPESHPYGDVSLSRLLGSFFSGSYSYKNRYLFDAAVRRDGSSAFGAQSRYANFWSGGLGWNVHNEAFFKSVFPGFSRLKLTATYGVTGSVDFNPFQARTTYEYNMTNWYSSGVGASVNSYGNEDLKWQRTTSYDFKAEIGLFKDRIVVTPVYYNKMTTGLLTDINLAPSVGFTTYKANLGNMRNNGYELYLTVNAYKSEHLNINITGNLAHNTNTIVKISNALKSYNENVDKEQYNEDAPIATPLVRFNEGQSYTAIYANKSRGIDPQSGKEIFERKDGSLTYIYDPRDVRPMGDFAAKAEGNFGSNITWKQFMFSFNFYYKFGGQQYNQTLVDRVENADPRWNVDRRAFTQRWKNPGDVAMYKNIADLSTTYPTSRFIEKDNLVSLTSLYLSYDITHAQARKIGLQSLRAALSMNDVFRAASVQQERGIDYPFARNLTASILATF